MSVISVSSHSIQEDYNYVSELDEIIDLTNDENDEEIVVKDIDPIVRSTSHAYRAGERVAVNSSSSSSSSSSASLPLVSQNSREEPANLPSKQQRKQIFHGTQMETENIEENHSQERTKIEKDKNEEIDKEYNDDEESDSSSEESAINIPSSARTSLRARRQTVYMGHSDPEDISQLAPNINIKLYDGLWNELEELGWVKCVYGGVNSVLGQCSRGDAAYVSPTAEPHWNKEQVHKLVAGFDYFNSVDEKATNEELVRYLVSNKFLDVKPSGEFKLWWPNKHDSVATINSPRVSSASSSSTVPSAPIPATNIKVEPIRQQKRKYGDRDDKIPVPQPSNKLSQPSLKTAASVSAAIKNVVSTAKIHRSEPVIAPVLSPPSIPAPRIELKKEGALAKMLADLQTRKLAASRLDTSTATNRGSSHFASSTGSNKLVTATQALSKLPSTSSSTIKPQQSSQLPPTSIPTIKAKSPPQIASPPLSSPSLFKPQSSSQPISASSIKAKSSPQIASPPLSSPSLFKPQSSSQPMSASSIKAKSSPLLPSPSLSATQPSSQLPSTSQPQSSPQMMSQSLSQSKSTPLLSNSTPTQSEPPPSLVRLAPISPSQQLSQSQSSHTTYEAFQTTNEYRTAANKIENILAECHAEGRQHIKKVFEVWKQAGWRKLGLPQLPNHMWVHDSAYFAPWCPTAPWLNPSVHLSTAPASLLAIAVAGRDYFFYNEDVERYLLTFGNRPDSVGLSAARSGGSATSGRVRSNPAWQTHSKRTSSSSSSSGDSIRSLTPAQLQEYWISNGFIFPLDLSLDALLDEDSEDRQISLWDSRTENDIARMFFYVRIRRFKAKTNGKFDSRDGLCVCVKLTGPSAPLWGIFFTSDSAVGQHEELGLNDLYRAAADFQNGALQPKPVVKIAVASKDCQTDPVEFAKTDELDEKIHQLEKDLAIKDQQILIWKDRYSSMANRGNQEREELRATNSDMKNEIKDKQSQISKLRDSINGYKDSDKRLRERCEALEEERDASRQRSKSKYEADIRRVREEERKRIMFQAASSSNAIVPAFIPSAPVSAEVSVGDAVKSWVSFQEGLKEFIHYDEVDIVKPPDFSIKSFFEDNDSVNGTASMLIADPDSLESSSYPVGITLSIFQKRNTRDRCIPFIRVKFQQEVRFTGLNRGGGDKERRRTRIVNSEAVDMGGLVAEWLDDVMGVLTTYLTPLDRFATDRVSPCEGAVEGESNEFFPIFSCMNNGLHFFPSRLATASSSNEQVFERISLTRVLTNKEEDKQRKQLLVLYESFGKILSQMIRQDLPIPEAFSSPLLIMYLVDGLEKMIERADISLVRWVRILEELDYETYGALESPVARLITEIVLSMESSSSYEFVAKHRLFDEVMMPHVLEPRLESLDAIRRGFLMVDLTERLSQLTVEQFIVQFCSRSFVSSGLLLPVLNIDNSVPGFRETVSAAITRLDPEQCSRLLKFATGSAHFQAKLHIKIEPKLEEFAKYPEYPFVTSLTCSNMLMVPCPLVPEHEAFTVDNALTNLLNSLNHGMYADFDDNAAMR